MVGGVDLFGETSTRFVPDEGDDRLVVLEDEAEVAEVEDELLLLLLLFGDVDN